jgi:hypothetical protein
MTSSPLAELLGESFYTIGQTHVSAPLQRYAELSAVLPLPATTTKLVSVPSTVTVTVVWCVTASSLYVVVMGTWIVVVTVFSALVVPRRGRFRRRIVGTVWGESVVMVVSIESVVVVVEGMVMVRRLGSKVRFRGCVWRWDFVRIGKRELSWLRSRAGDVVYNFGGGGRGALVAHGCKQMEG